MAVGKAENFKIHDSEEFGGPMAKPAIAGAMVLSASSIDGDAAMGAVLGAVSISAAYVGSPVWSLIQDGSGQFTINASTGAVSVDSALTPGATSIKVKVKGTTPPIQSTVFVVTINDVAATYDAPAVHFDGSSSLRNPSLTATDNGLMAFSVWLNVPADGNATQIPWATDPENDYLNSFGVSGTGLQNPQCSLSDGSIFAVLNGNVPTPLGEWVHFCGSADTNFGTGEKIGTIFMNDVNISASVNDFGAGAVVPTFNGLPFFVGDDTFGDALIGDMADMWVAPGQFVDFTVEANRRKFIDAEGKPVNLGATGATPTGTAPAVFLSGNSASFGTNKGTGGAFVLTGSLTNASTGPSD